MVILDKAGEGGNTVLRCQVLPPAPNTHSGKHNKRPTLTLLYVPSSKAGVGSSLSLMNRHLKGYLAHENNEGGKE